MKRLSIKSATIVLMTLLLLTACVKGNSRALPDVREYTAAEQTQAADELEQNPIPRLREFMKDYKVMRDQTRSLRDEK